MTKDIKSYKMLINGEWTSSEDNSYFDSLNPSTGKVWCKIPEATTIDVDRAVKAANKAFCEGPWASMTPTQTLRQQFHQLHTTITTACTTMLVSHLQCLQL